MSASNSRQDNPVIGEFYRHLVSRGKTSNAGAACMRNLLVPKNARVTRGRVGNPTFAIGLPLRTLPQVDWK
jgi:hypothetical protein